MEQKTLCLTRAALLSALALGLSYMERFIPLGLLVPLPGIKLGLANVVTLAALCTLGVRSAGAVLLCRCTLGAIFSGSLTALVFSLTGGLLALGVMILSLRLPFLSIYGVSVLGAAAHNVGQICAAMVIMKSVHVAAYLPVLLLTGVVCGLVTGALAAGTLQKLPRAFWEKGGAPCWNKS